MQQAEIGWQTSRGVKLIGQVRALVPLFETEVRGVEALTRLSDALFA